LVRQDRLGLISRPSLPLWVLVGGLVVGIAAAWMVRLSQVSRARVRFGVAVAESRDRLDQRLRDCEDLIRGVRGLAQAQGGVDRARFKAFLESMEIESRYPGLLGVTYGVPVPPRDRDRVLKTLRSQQERPELEVYPGWGFEQDAVVLYAEPLASNLRVLGFNSGSSPNQWQSLAEARDSGQIQASPAIKVAQAPEGGPGLVLRLAIYDRSSVPPSLEARRRAFSGYVNAVFLIHELARGAFARAASDGVSLSLTDTSDASAAFLKGGRDGGGRWWHRFAPEGFSALENLAVGGRSWQLGFTADRSFYQPGEVAYPWITLVAWGLIGGLLASLLRAVGRTGQRAQELAKRMTETSRRNEARLQAITRVMPDAILVLDGEGRYREVLTQDPSRLAAPPEHLIGRTVAEVLSPELADLVMKTIGQVLEDQGVHALEYSLETQKGILRFDARVAPMESGFEDQPCVLWVARDVTERDSQQMALRQAQKLESLGVLAGGIAHDFNNLLAAIQGHLSLGRLAVEDGRDPSHNLERMEASIQRAADLARQLLAYSGHGSFQIQALDINAVVREMSGLLSVSRSKLVALEVDLQEGLPAIRADRVQLQQVVMNLVTNASEAIGERPGVVTLRTSRSRFGPWVLEQRMAGQGLEPGEFVTLQVQDNGSGMPEEVLDRIFDPFFTTKPTGRGLGLSAIRGILRAHRAGIEITSRLGEGTTITLHFPMTEETHDPGEEGAAAATPVKAFTGILLLAEDEPVIRDLSTQMAERLGFQVLGAEDGEVAWEAFQARESEITAVVLDLTMPRRGGAEVYALIRERAPRLPILLCSGYSKEAIPEALGPDEPRGFLQKPFTYAQFETALRGLLKQG